MLHAQLFFDRNCATLFGTFPFTATAVVKLGITPDMRMSWPGLTEDNGRRDGNRVP